MTGRKVELSHRVIVGGLFDEVFTYEEWTWNVSLARRLIGDAPPNATLLPAQAVAMLVQDPATGRPDPDGNRRDAAVEAAVLIDKYAALADERPDAPPVAIPSWDRPGAIMVIGGWSAIYRAWRLGRPELPCYLLSPEAERAVRVSQPAGLLDRPGVAS